ncbi:SRPBCC domain-containing protein [Halomonas kalidii]|uniref:SRPBCC domain-containing protein n=1 Tax=Halomonas kalidii TaxID=3043293 RepID=A0ABT6VSG0_9GAMM|nr:SRPBCC domain-containing protein [Halomonas kalidii]MDI5935721.1 SRPBCC domain-containing protein [Halomonas kalidii]
MTDDNHISVSISRDFAASPERLFDAWLDPAMVRHWFAPGLGEMVRVEIDPRVGGTFRLDQQRGDELAQHWGTYVELERPRRLVFSWCVDGVDGEDLVTIDIAPVETGSRLTITHRMEADFAEYADLTRQGWGMMLEGMARGLASQSQHGQLFAPDSIRFERLLPGPIERVWAYLTESDKRARWLAAGSMAPRPGSAFALHFDHAGLSPQRAPAPDRFRHFEGGCTTQHEIRRFEPPHVLVMTWGDGREGPSEVTFELSEEGNRVRLVLTHRRLGDVDTLVDVAGGWHTHLAILVEVLEGRTPPPFWPLFERMEEEYRWHITSRRT